jgi:hypothetical protein
VDDEDSVFTGCSSHSLIFVSVFNHLCLPIMYVDGAFAKDPLYDGTIIILVAKLGNGSTSIPLAIAHVPIKSSVHLVWLLLLLVWAGLDVEAFPWFSDRGYLLSASRFLFSQYGLLLSIKYCLEHIIRNVTVKFGLKKLGQTQLHTLIQECQTSQTIAHFDFAIEKVFDYPQSTTKPLCSYKMALYLLSVHPIHWTVFGNHQSSQIYLVLGLQTVGLAVSSPTWDGQRG